MNTIISIPGREVQTIPGFTMTADDVISSFAGTIDLSSFAVSETTNDSGDAVITFSTRTGTKGHDVNVTIENLNVSGDLVINATRIEIPGREAQVIPNANMSASDVVAAFAGTLDLNQYESSESYDESIKVVRFSTRTGTKGSGGQVDISEIFRALSGQVATAAAPTPEVVVEEDEYTPVTLHNTRIIIPGREVQDLPGMVLDASQVRSSFSGSLDLSGYDVEENDLEDGTLEVRFTARTGTKG